jgi:Cyclopropane fatty acid synthase and related methyltransferases
MLETLKLRAKMPAVSKINTGDPTFRTFRKALQDLLRPADVRINGDRAWDMKIHDTQVYRRILAEGSLGLGESYVEGAWDCERLDEFICRILKARLDRTVKNSLKLFPSLLLAKVVNLQSKTRAIEVAKTHYDLDSELFERMLDKRMLYTCAYWDGAKDLEQAQVRKLDLVCRKIGLKKGMKVLDLGCGWGSFAKFAAEKYGARVVGLNISQRQVEWGRESCKGLPVELKQLDYREAQGKFDRVVSIGLMEQVGPKNYRTYFEVVDRCLARDGIAFIHTIGNNVPYAAGDPWFDKYIFPNFVIPSLSQMFAAMEGRFIAEDLHNIGPHYDRTLMEWNRRFQKGWDRLRTKFSESFKRMWEYYLLSSAGAFRSRELQLWQIVMTRPGMAQPRCRFS